MNAKRLAVVIGLVLIFAGCKRKGFVQQQAGASRAADVVHHDEALDHALYSLMHMERYGSPEMMGQLIDRLDQWIQNQKPIEGWRVDPMVEQLPPHLKNVADRLKLEELRFKPGDRGALYEAVWLHDIGKWARKDAADPLQVSINLFDWVVRNIAIEELPPQLPQGVVPVLRFPWEILLFGRGTPTDRAWLFVLLLRQQEIDAGLISVLKRDPSGAARYVNWAVGVLIDGKIYVFDPSLGIPIPAADGLGKTADGALTIRPATLAELRADDSLFRRLDLSPTQKFPLSAEDLQQVRILVDCSPAYLSQKMFLLEAKLAGKYGVVLTARPSEQADRFRRNGLVSEVLPWGYPYEVYINLQQLGPARISWLQQNLLPFEFMIGGVTTLWRGRNFHFKGIFSGDESAIDYYQAARIPNRIIEKNPQPEARSVMQTMKLHASYWLGLVAFEQGNWDTAIDYFQRRVLEAFPNNPWQSAANYNLGRTYEAAGQTEKAIQVYRSDTGSPYTHGNYLRAKWLEEIVLQRTTTQAGEASVDQEQTEVDKAGQESSSQNATEATGNKPTE